MVPGLDPDLRLLLGGILGLLAVVALLVLAGAWIQVHRDRQNQRRIAHFRVWEKDLAIYLFQGIRPFPPIAPEDRELFQSFLARYHQTLAGQEAEALRELYLHIGVHHTVAARLRSRIAPVRAQAVQEVSLFRLWDHLDAVGLLLEDPAPYVSHLAAQALARSRDLRHAPPVFRWIRRESRYQRERLLRVLEAFGPELLPWMEVHLAAPARDPGPWILFALLTASHRHRESESRLLDLLEVPHTDLQASALKALGALADPRTYAQVLPMARHADWPVRAQAAKALGLIGGPQAIPILTELAGDAVFEVRRNAAQGLADLGHAGTEALAWLSEDPGSDRFARDMARERLEWAHERGHQ